MPKRRDSLRLRAEDKKREKRYAEYRDKNGRIKRIYLPKSLADFERKVPSFYSTGIIAEIIRLKEKGKLKGARLDKLIERQAEIYKQMKDSALKGKKFRYKKEEQKRRKEFKAKYGVAPEISRIIPANTEARIGVTMNQLQNDEETLDILLSSGPVKNKRLKEILLEHKEEWKGLLWYEADAEVGGEEDKQEGFYKLLMHEILPNEAYNRITANGLSEGMSLVAGTIKRLQEEGLADNGSRQTSSGRIRTITIFVSLANGEVSE